MADRNATLCARRQVKINYRRRIVIILSPEFLKKLQIKHANRQEEKENKNQGRLKDGNKILEYIKR